MTSPDRKGRAAEAVAAWWLRLRGYRVLARRFATPVGEIDLIARRGAELIFVEVKNRPSLADGLDAIDARQRGRIARAAEWYLFHRAPSTDCSCRFDVLVVVPWRLPYHLPDAWRPIEARGRRATRRGSW